MQKENLLRLEPVMSRTGKRRSTIYAEVAAGRFPAPIKIGRRAVAWIESEIDRYVADLIASARGGPADGHL
jgi:prophage regulatory protein